MKRAVVLATISCATFAVACGTILASPDDDPTPPGPTGGEAGVDGGAPDGNAGAAIDASPPIVRTCPTRECDKEDKDAGEVCEDDLCDEPDFDRTGAIAAVNDECVASPASGEDGYLTATHERTRETMSVALSFDVKSASTERTIASIRAGTAADAERFEAVVRNGSILLCERSGGGETCTPGVPLPKSTRVHLYGLLSSDTPARGSFALSLGACTAEQLLPVTTPFAEGKVAGSAGCLPGAGDCAITMDGLVFFARPE